MRELIWLLIALLFGYAAFQVVRALRINLAKPAAEQRARDEATTAMTGQTDGDEHFVAPATPGSDSGSSASSLPAEAGGEAFQLTLEVQQLRQELARLQADLSGQREQVARLEDALALLREQLDAAVASQGVSPEYNEALVFARRGLDVDTIAERCGISVAEAELVRSLAQGGTTDREGA